MPQTSKSNTHQISLETFVHATLAGAPLQADEGFWALIGKAMQEITERDLSAARATIDSLPDADSDLQSFAVEIQKLRVATLLTDLKSADSCINRLRTHPLSNDPLAVAVRDFMTGCACFDKVEVDVALKHLLNAGCYFRSLGWHYENAVCEHQIGLALLDLGDHTNAIQKLLSITEIFRNNGPRNNYAILTANLAHAFFVAERYQEAEAQYMAALEQAPFAERRLPRAELLLNIALINKKTGQYETAELSYRHSLSIAEAQGALALRAKCLSALAELEMMRGELSTAKDLVEITTALPQNQLYVSTRLQVAGTQAFLANEDGNQDVAITVVREAIELGLGHNQLEHVSLLISDVLEWLKDTGVRLQLLEIYARVQDQRLSAVSQNTMNLVDMHTRFQNEHKRLEVELRREHSQIMLESQSATMNEIGREIHDSIGQNLTVLLRLSEQLLNEIDHIPTGQRPVVATMHKVCSRVIEDARRIASQIVEESAPHGPIDVALEELADDVRRALPQLELQVLISGSFTDISQLHARTLYRAAQNLLLNVMQHSEATFCTLNLVAHDDHYHLAIEDNGKGFDPVAVRSGMGLRELRARADLLGGEVTVDGQPGHGSYVDVRLPRAAKDA